MNCKKYDKTEKNRFSRRILGFLLGPAPNRNGFPYNCLSISRKWKKKFMAMYRVYYSLGKILKLQDLRNIFFAMCHEVFEIWNFCHSNWLTTKPGTQQTLNTHFKFNFTSHTAVVSRKQLSKRWTTLMSKVSRWVSRYFLLTRITSS